MLRRINTIFDNIITYLAYFGCALIAFIVLSVTAEVFTRFFLNRSLVWVTEIDEYAMIAFTFFAAAWVLKREGHVVLDVVINRFKPQNRAAVNTITSILSAIVCGVIFWYGTSNLLYHLQEGTLIASKTIDIPKAPMLIFIPLGFLLFAIQFLRRAYGFIRVWRGATVLEEKVQVEKYFETLE